MPGISYASLHALSTLARFAADALVVDTRFQRHASWTPEMVAPLFAARYVHVPALGSLACANGEGGDAGQVIAWSEGLEAVRAVHVPGQQIVVLCGCQEVNGRSHRRLVAHELARELALEEAGPLP